MTTTAVYGRVSKFIYKQSSFKSCLQLKSIFRSSSIYISIYLFLYKSTRISSEDNHVFSRNFSAIQKYKKYFLNFPFFACEEWVQLLSSHKIFKREKIFWKKIFIDSHSLVTCNGKRKGKGLHPSKVVFHRRSPSIKGHLPSKIVFPQKFVIHQRFSCIKGCLPSKVVFHQTCLPLLYPMSSRTL